MRSESAFALTEVLIAAVLLVLVSGAFLQLVVGSTRAQTTSKVRQQQQAIIENLIEHLHTDTSWTDQCVQSKPAATCAAQIEDIIKHNNLAVDAKSGTQFDLEASAKPIDSPGDGTGAADKDGIIADYFKLSATVTSPDPSVAKFSTTSVIDPYSSNSSGTVRVDVCKLPFQSDDRMVISGCAKTDWMPVDPGDLQDAGANDKELTNFKALGALPDALSDTTVKAWSQVKVQPVTGLAVSLVDSDGKTCDTCSGTLGSDGGIDLKKIPPGQYTIQLSGKAYDKAGVLSGYEAWTKFSSPNGTVVVAPYQVTSGLLLYRRPADRNYTIRVESVERNPVTGQIDESKRHLGVKRTVRLKLLPMPVGRDGDLKEGPGNGDAQLPYAVQEFELNGEPVSAVSFRLRPGLYRPVVLNDMGGTELLTHYKNGVRSPLNYIWVAPQRSAGETANVSNTNYPLGVATSAATEAARVSEDAALYTVPLSGYQPPVDNDSSPITYPAPQLPAPSCSYYVDQIGAGSIVQMGGELVADFLRIAASFLTGQTSQYTSANSVLPQARHCDEQHDCRNIIGQKIKNYNACVSRTCPNYQAPLTVFGVNLIPQRGVNVGQYMPKSRVNIYCAGPKSSKCTQSVNFAMPKGLVELTDGFFGSLLGYSQSGGVVNVYCMANASCNQSADVGGGSGKVNNFVCYPRSTCDQRGKFISGGTSSLTAFGITLSDPSGYANFKCWAGDNSTKCSQSLPLPGGALATLSCFPQGKCNQKIGDDVIWATANSGATMECHTGSTCQQGVNLSVSMSTGFGLQQILNSTQKKSSQDLFDMIFGTSNQPTNSPISMVCRQNSDCNQQLKMTSFQMGINQWCHRGATQCHQSIFSGTSFANPGNIQKNLTNFWNSVVSSTSWLPDSWLVPREDRVLQTPTQFCGVDASPCSQLTYRMTLTYWMRQECYAPRPARFDNPPVLSDKACNQNGSSTTEYKYGPFGLIKWPVVTEASTYQTCYTSKSCTQAIAAGGLFANPQAVAYDSDGNKIMEADGVTPKKGPFDLLQKCYSVNTCSQDATRQVSFVGNVHDVVQKCTVRDGTCHQSMQVADDAQSTNKGGTRQQICDGGPAAGADPRRNEGCTQELYGVSNKPGKVTDFWSWAQNMFAQWGNDINSYFVGLFGNGMGNDTYQACNSPADASPFEWTPENPPAGSFSENGTGGT